MLGSSTSLSPLNFKLIQIVRTLGETAKIVKDNQVSTKDPTEDMKVKRLILDKKDQLTQMFVYFILYFRQFVHSRNSVSDVNVRKAQARDEKKHLAHATFEAEDDNDQTSTSFIFEPQPALSTD